MKVVLYAPDSALPQHFTALQAMSFRVWAQAQLEGVFPDCDAKVSAEPLIDASCQLAAVEGGSPAKAAEVYGYCQKLISRFCELESIDRRAPRARQVWIGGFCKWEEN